MRTREMHLLNNLSLLLYFIIRLNLKNQTCIMHMNQYSTNISDDYFFYNPVTMNNIPVYLQNSKNVEDFNINRSYCLNYLITSDSPTDVLYHIEQQMLKSESYTYNNRKYLIAVKTNDVFEKLFESDLLHFIRNVLIIKMESFFNINGLNSPSLSTDNTYGDYEVFKLYTHKFIGRGNTNAPILLDTWMANNNTFCGLNSKEKLEVFGNTTKLFPDKETDEQGRRLRIVQFEVLPYVNTEVSVGSEYNLFVDFLETYNIDCYNQSIKSYKTIGGYFMGSSGNNYFNKLLTSNKHINIDIMFGAVPGDWKINKYLDFVISSYFELLILVPKPFKYIGWLSAIKAFQPSIWICVLTAFPLLHILLVLSRIAIIDIYKNPQSPQKISILSFLSMLVYEKHTDNYLFARLVLLLSLILSFYFETCYGSHILSILISPIYINDMHTIASVIDAELTIITQDLLYGILLDDEKEATQKLLYQIRVIRDPVEYKHALVQVDSGISAIFFESGFIDIITPEIMDTTILSNYTKLHETVAQLQMNFVLRKNSMYTEQLRSVVQRARESGLISQWERIAFQTLGSGLSRDALHFLHNVEKEPLGIQHIKSPLAVLIIGLTLSILLFALEYFKFKILTP